VWWYTCIIPVLGSLRQEDEEFETSLGYIVRPYEKKREKKGKKERTEGRKEGRKERKKEREKKHIKTKQ
jgi:hypothetical protein